MSYLLADPSVVVFVGGSSTDRDRLRSAVSDGAATETIAAGGIDEAESVLEARDDVGCVVALGESPPLSDLQPAVSAASDHLPLVAYRSADDGVAADLAHHANCRYLPRSAPVETLRAVVDDALDEFERHREAAADSSMFRSLLAEGHLSMFVKDRDGRYLRMADVPYTPGPDEVLGKTDLEVWDNHGQTSRQAYEDDLEVVETGEPIREQLEPFNGAGGEHWSEVTKVPWADDGEIRGVVGYSVDVTDRVRAERELEEQRRRFDQFASYVSHDLRTPLQVSVGALQRARNGNMDALDKIERANQRIEEIIDDLSDLSKGDRSATSLSEEVLEALDVGVASTELRPLVENVWAVTGGDATLDLQVPEGTEVVAETETLRPLVENLLKNALDHAGADVTVTVGTVDRGFYIADDGPGIPVEERERVFEEGYTTADEGSGTGLAIVRETADQRDWTLTVSESDAGGARFEIGDVAVITPVDATPTTPLTLTGSRDVGSVSVAGDATYDDARDRWTVVANGRDIWQDIDEFHFAHAEASMPVRIQGRIPEFDGIEPYSKAGLMVRSTLDDHAAFGFVGATSEHGTETLWRTRDGEHADSTQFEEPYDAYQWYRIDAVDDEVTLSFSTDGEEWHHLDQRPIELGDTVQAGIVACSHTDDETITVEFTDVSASDLAVDADTDR